jgi:hypothetical protein
LDLCTSCFGYDDVYCSRIERWYENPETSQFSRTPADTEITVANAVGPWVASYNTYTSGTVTSTADTPIWILIAAGLLLGLGFWCTLHMSDSCIITANPSISLRLPRHALPWQQDYSGLAYSWVRYGTWRGDHRLACVSSRTTSGK